VGTLIATYIVIFAARRQLGDSRFWQNLISLTGLGIVLVLLLTGWLNQLSILQEYLGAQVRFGKALCSISSSSPAAWLSARCWPYRWASGQYAACVLRAIFFIANITQTVPSLALFGLFDCPAFGPLLRLSGTAGIRHQGRSVAPAVIALVPVFHAAYRAQYLYGSAPVDPAVIDAGLGMAWGISNCSGGCKSPWPRRWSWRESVCFSPGCGNATLAALIGAGAWAPLSSMG